MQKGIVHLLLATSLLASLSALAEEGPADARRHMIRGIAAIEIARSNADLAVAADEFRRATELDPTLAAAWYNLGSVQGKMGQFDAAIESYKHYLVLAPKAEDAQKVEDEIVKLEFQQEQIAKSKSRGGTWIGPDGTPYALTVDGNRITLTTDRHLLSDNEAESTYTMVGKMPITNLEQVTYHLDLTGNRLSGTWMHSAVPTEKCTIPEESGDVTGELRSADGAIELHYVRTKYRAATQMAVLTDDYCAEVVPVEKRKVETVFRGPLPPGGLGITVGGLTSYWAGGFSTVKFGWSGHLVVQGVAQDSAAYAAGLRPDDEILSIDGVEVKTLSAQDALLRLRGQVGSEVALGIQAHGAKEEPSIVHMRRVAVPAYTPESKLGWLN